LSRRDDLIVAWSGSGRTRNAFKKTTRPVGHGLSWSTRTFTAYGGRSFPATQSHRTGRFPFSHPFQAVNCLATFIPSLRDKNSSSTPVRKIETTQNIAHESRTRTTTRTRTTAPLANRQTLPLRRRWRSRRYRAPRLRFAMWILSLRILVLWRWASFFWPARLLRCWRSGGYRVRSRV